MYAVGTSILYGRTGVCRVEHIGAPPFRDHDGGSYYTLRSVFSTSGELIYIPVDTAVSMRPLIGGREASAHLDRIPGLKPEAFRSRKPAELAAHYQEALGSCEPERCLLLIKEIHQKERELSAHKKKLGQVDFRYLKIAERLVCEEFAVALDTSLEAVRRRVYAAMECEAPAQQPGKGAAG